MVSLLHRLPNWPPALSRSRLLSRVRRSYEYTPSFLLGRSPKALGNFRPPFHADTYVCACGSTRHSHKIAVNINIIRYIKSTLTLFRVIGLMMLMLLVLDAAADAAATADNDAVV